MDFTTPAAVTPATREGCLLSMPFLWLMIPKILMGNVFQQTNQHLQHLLEANNRFSETESSITWMDITSSWLVL